MTEAESWGDTIIVTGDPKMVHRAKRLFQWWNAKRKRDLDEATFRVIDGGLLDVDITRNYHR